MAHRTTLTRHRLHEQWRWIRHDLQRGDGLPLLRLAAAVLVALMALATASGLIGA
jgi:hypothetical protein